MFDCDSIHTPGWFCSWYLYPSNAHACTVRNVRPVEGEAQKKPYMHM